MGCGRVDLIDLFDLARGNIGPVRRRELQAHLAACPPCSDDYTRLCSLEETFSAVREETSASLKPTEISRLEVRLMEVVSQFDQVKARKLWQPQSATAERRRVKRRRWGRRLLKWTAVVVLLVALGGGAWVAHAVYLGSGYPEEPVWRLALLLPEKQAAAVMRVLPVRGAEELVGDILMEKREKSLLPLAQSLAGASGQKGLSKFLRALNALARQRPDDAFAGALLLYPYCREGDRWEKGAAVLTAAREGRLEKQLEDLPETLRGQLAALLGT